MTMGEWAENEINIANTILDANEDRYFLTCVKSAYKALKSLMEDRHSGMSIGVTQTILNRLIDGKPLTPITESDFVGVQSVEGFSQEQLHEQGLKSVIQCPRMFSLFRDERLDGEILYSDDERYCCFDKKEPDMTYRESLGRKIIDELYPIKMPYMPASEMYRICMESVGKTEAVKAVRYIITPDYLYVPVNRYFKLGEKDWIEITEKEYEMEMEA